jgi:murein DD-endopeptidase MepM/ murein hydrolase activator NlpD
VIIETTVSGKPVYQFYAHLSSIGVRSGQSVEKGQAIGVIGDTGQAYGKHLHYAVTDTLWETGSYYGYATKFNGNSICFKGVAYYNPKYIIENGKLP